MAALAGIPVISFLSPQNGAPIPTHRSLFGSGGWKNVASTAERDAIPAARREVGMAVYVSSVDTLYLLKSDLVTWDAYLKGVRINVASPATGDVLTFDGTSFVNKPNSGGGGGGGSFNPTITSVQNGDVITYNATTNRWENKAPVTGFTPVITSPTLGDILAYDPVSGKWINRKPTFNPTVTAPADGDLMTYNAATSTWVNKTLGDIDMGVI